MEHFLEHPRTTTAPRSGGAVPGVLPALRGTAGGAELTPGADVPLDAETNRFELIRAVTDHVAGMTDRYAQRVYLDLYVPKCWGHL